MSHSKYTGKSATTHVTWDGAAIPTGWRKVTIAEKGKPAIGQIDGTVAADTAYAFADDPMGAKGSASVVITIEGYLSVTDSTDAGMTEEVVDSVGVLLIHKKATGDLFTATNAVYKGMTTEAAIGAIIPYTVTFELASSAGAWSTAA
jgi:hypothetical protein